MTRYIVAAVLLGLYALGSAWIVRSEGEAYRKALHQERLAGRRAVEPKPKPKPGKAIDAGRSLASRPPSPPAATSLETTTPATAPAETMTSPPPPPPTGPAPAAVSSSAPADPASAPAPEPIARILGRDPFWSSAAMKQEWDLAHLTTRDEIRLGQALHDLVLHFNTPVADSPELERIEQAAAPVLETRSRKDIPYTFTVLDSDAVNAFSHPGGYVYVTRGLFDLIGEDEDYALQFVLGHEIAHVDLGHALKCLQDPAVKTLGIGTLAQFYYLVFPLGYLDAQDFEADRWIYDRMMRLDRTRRESLAFLRKLLGYARSHGFENRRMRPALVPETPLLENHIRAHPLVRSRLKRLEPPK